MERHLWDTEHPYYWNEGCFHENGHHFRYSSFAKFMAERGDADEDLNLVARWDWEEDKDDADLVIEPGKGILKVFYVVQRKGFTQSCECPVTAADEPDVRAFLAAKWEHMRRLWEPLSLSMPTAPPAA